MFRSSHWSRCSVTKGVLRNFAKFTGKHLCQSLFFNKVAGSSSTLFKKRIWHRSFPANFAKFLTAPLVTEHLRHATLLKKKLWYRCFPVNFAKFLRTLFVTKTHPVAASDVVEEKLQQSKLKS